MNPSPHVLILGAGYAGLMAVLRIRAQAPRAKITVVNGTDHFVERIRLHQMASGQTVKPIPLQKLLPKNVTFVQAWVEAILPDQKAVQVSLQGQKQTLTYDYLIVALGSHIDRDSVAGVREYAHTLDAQTTGHLQQALPNAKKLVICGGGLTGIEAATEFAQAFPSLEITLVTQGRLGANLSQKGADYLHRVFREAGIKRVENTSVQAITAQHIETSHGHLPYDVVVWAGKFSVPKIAQNADIQTNTLGQIKVDAYQRSLSHPDIFAIGDISVFAHTSPLRMACATAMPMGAKVGDNISALINHQPMTPFRFGYFFRCISLGRKRGLVQFVSADDTPQERVLTGRLGGLVKEMICRFTVWSVRMERVVPKSYRYPQGTATQTPLKQGVEHG